MSQLTDRGWVASTASSLTALVDRRRTYYELAEPLARISFQIKGSRGQPLRLVVEFLKHWFDPAELALGGSDRVALQYAVLATAEQDSDPAVAVIRPCGFTTCVQGDVSLSSDDSNTSRPRERPP